MTNAEQPKGIKIRRELYVSAPDENTADSRVQNYTNGAGLRRVEHRFLAREGDWANEIYERFSDDNGRTWGPWQDVFKDSYEQQGDDEIMFHIGGEAYNPRHGHFVSVAMRRVFFGGHTKAYESLWGRGAAEFFDHCLLALRPDGAKERSYEMIKYEEGADFDPANWRNPAYIENNLAYYGGQPDVLENGDIIFTIAPNIRACCRILGLDINDVFPSCPDIMNGLMVVRGKYNPDHAGYDLSFSRPVVINDLKSSRGVAEPLAIRLLSGRILSVFRGSNVITPHWNTRILPGTPGHKWFCWSDDDGKTFTEPAPWHFDNGEVLYSSATISSFFRNPANGKIYWIGNATDHTALGNWPRAPLNIAEVNEHGILKRETLTTIDDREEGDAPELQLSNFSIVQDRETGLLELYLVKLGQRKHSAWHADCYRYFITLPD